VFLKRENRNRSKKKKITMEEAIEENEDTFERLMKTLGYKKNGNGKDGEPEWVGEKGCFFNGVQTINEEDEK
jgi:hypothetical protein